MFALALTIICTTSIGVIIKLSENRIKERFTMLFFNYIVATIVSIFLFYLGNRIYATDSSTGGVIIEIDWTLSNAAKILAPLGGLIFALNFFLMIVAIKKRGVALPVSLMRLSAIVPIAVSLIFLNESPKLIQIIGMIGALVAAVMMSLSFRGGELMKTDRNASKLILAISSFALLLCFGLGDLTMRLFQEFGRSNEKHLFLAILFGCAGLFVLIALIVKRVKIRLTDALWGLLLGIPNYFSALFIVMALERFPSFVVFPVVTSVTVMLIALIGKIFFKEEIGGLGLIAIGLTILSVIAINL